MANNETYLLLDIRGMVLHGYNIGKDPDAKIDDDQKPYNTATWGMERFLETYPIFETVPPRQIIAVWDGGNEYRKTLYKKYKKRRGERAEEQEQEFQ